MQKQPQKNQAKVHVNKFHPSWIKSKKTSVWIYCSFFPHCNDCLLPSWLLLSLSCYTWSNVFCSDLKNGESYAYVYMYFWNVNHICNCAKYSLLGLFFSVLRSPISLSALFVWYFRHAFCILHEGETSVDTICRVSRKRTNYSIFVWGQWQRHTYKHSYY